VVETAHEETNSILSNLPKKSLDSEDFDMKLSHLHRQSFLLVENSSTT
jgi:hypothetical protein